MIGFYCNIIFKRLLMECAQIFPDGGSGGAGLKSDAKESGRM